VSDENIGKNVKGLFIRQSNLKYLDDEIVNDNLRKICYQDLLAEYPRDNIVEIWLLYWLILPMSLAINVREIASRRRQRQKLQSH
jgi:hypothetical protein